MPTIGFWAGLAAAPFIYGMLLAGAIGVEMLYRKLRGPKR